MDKIHEVNYVKWLNNLAIVLILDNTFISYFLKDIPSCDEFFHDLRTFGANFVPHSYLYTFSVNYFELKRRISQLFFSFRVYDCHFPIREQTDK